MTTKIIAVFNENVARERAEEIITELNGTFEYQEMIDVHIITPPSDVSQTQFMNRLGQYSELKSCAPEGELSLM
jgi:hypothetical protein